MGTEGQNRQEPDRKKSLKKDQKSLEVRKRFVPLQSRLRELAFYGSSLTRLKGSKQVQASTENEEYESVNSQN